MAGRVSKALKDQLIAEGRWQDFCDRRDELKAEGFSAADARGVAISEFTGAPPPSRGRSAAAAAPPVDPDGDELYPPPAELAGRKASEPAIVRWVARHIDHLGRPDPSTCPDPFAWTLLRQCRNSPAFTQFFVEKLWAKLIPSRSQLDTSASKTLDGKPTIELIEKIQAMRDESIERAAEVLGLRRSPVSGEVVTVPPEEPNPEEDE